MADVIEQNANQILELLIRISTTSSNDDRRQCENQLDQFSISNSSIYIASIFHILSQSQKTNNIMEETTRILCISTLRKLIEQKQGLSKHFNAQEIEFVRNNLLSIVFQEPTDKISRHLIQLVSNIYWFDFSQWTNTLLSILFQNINSTRNNNDHQSEILQFRSIRCIRMCLTVLLLREFGGDDGDEGGESKILEPQAQIILDKIFDPLLQCSIQLWENSISRINSNQNQMNLNVERKITLFANLTECCKILLLLVKTTNALDPTSIQQISKVYSFLPSLIQSIALLLASTKDQENLSQSFKQLDKYVRVCLKLTTQCVRRNAELFLKHNLNSITSVLLQLMFLPHQRQSKLLDKKSLIELLQFFHHLIVGSYSILEETIATQLWNEQNITQLHRSLILEQLRIRKQDLDEWSVNSESFLAEEARNSWKTSTREGAMEVFTSLTSQFPELSKNVVMQLVQFYFELRNAEKQTFESICQQEALLRMISSSTNLLKDKISFETLWQHVLLPLFQQQNSASSLELQSLLQRRGFEILKKWIHLTSDRALVSLSLNITIQFQSQSPILGVKITATTTLAELLEHPQFNSELLIPNFETCWNSLMFLTSYVSETINAIEFIKLICIIVDKMQEKVSPFIDSLISHLLKIWHMSADQPYLKTELLLLFARISLYTVNEHFLQTSVVLIHWAIMQKSSIFLKDVLVLWSNVLPKAIQNQELKKSFLPLFSFAQGVFGRVVNEEQDFHQVEMFLQILKCFVFQFNSTTEIDTFSITIPILVQTCRDFFDRTTDDTKFSMISILQHALLLISQHQQQPQQNQISNYLISNENSLVLILEKLFWLTLNPICSPDLTFACSELWVLVISTQPNLFSKIVQKLSIPQTGKQNQRNFPLLLLNTMTSSTERNFNSKTPLEIWALGFVEILRFSGKEAMVQNQSNLQIVSQFSQKSNIAHQKFLELISQYSQ